MIDARFLLDANILIYLLNRSNSAAVRRAEEHHAGELITSSIAYAEVMLGAARLGEMAGAQRLFGVIGVRPFDRAAADVFARLPFRRGGFDRLIAAHALALDLTLVTNNARDFSEIPGLRVENWTK